MQTSSADQHARRVQTMFGRIAGRYDLLNALMTGGAYRRWQRETVRRLGLPSGGRALDLGCGTGDLTLDIVASDPEASVIAADFTPQMVRMARQRPGAERVQWLLADARYLPFASSSFDGVVSGYLLRNVPDVNQALAEQARVLAAGGRVAALDTSPPRPNGLRPFLQFWMNRVVPALGRLVAGDPEAYTYLSNSTAGFLSAEELAKRFRQAGFTAVGFVRRMLGSIAIHWGRKEGRPS